ncbi:MAG TPA: class I SAM-dependent methyltransferase [Chloroflexia bacterium]|nr:class I SAM-dependent methyltransferase [Chloroflexia bacterium]
MAEHSNATAQAFNLSAPFYDADQAHNRVARWSRARSLQVLDRAFAPGDRLLELGCGTGEEAIHLARRSISVVATDAAPAMLDVLKAKLSHHEKSISEHITPILISAGKIGSLVERFGKQSFDGVYSSFGPLNCEPDLAPIAGALADLVRPGGRVVLSLINRYCLWETAWYLAAGQPRLAFRRWHGVSEATVRAEWQHERVTIFYWTPGHFERTFGLYFRTTRHMALPWLLPPQYLDGLVRNRPRLFKRMARIDRRLSNRWPFYALGDHFLLEMVRTRA